jgi:hypothetical protein
MEHKPLQLVSALTFPFASATLPADCTFFWSCRLTDDFLAYPERFRFITKVSGFPLRFMPSYLTHMPRIDEIFP